MTQKQGVYCKSITFYFKKLKLSYKALTELVQSVALLSVIFVTLLLLVPTVDESLNVLKRERKNMAHEKSTDS